jgi:hypothetical protein
MCGSPDQAAYYHILGLYDLYDLYDLALGWLQIKEVSFRQ